VIRCLELAKGNPDVAFEILSIPPEQLAQMAQMHGGGGAGGYGDEDMGDDDGYGDELDGASGLANFLNNPNFQQIRERMINNPQFYEQFMSTLQQSQPDFFEWIQ
jgi:hypothetical protein